MCIMLPMQTNVSDECIHNLYIGIWGVSMAQRIAHCAIGVHSSSLVWASHCVPPSDSIGDIRYRSTQ